MADNVSVLLTLKDGFSNVANKFIGTLGKIDGRVKKNQDGFDALKSKVDGVAGAFWGITGAASKAGIAIGAALTGLAVKSSMDIEQANSTLTALLGSAEEAGKKLQWAIGFANETPFETDEVVNATTKLKLYGLAAEKVLPKIGDMAGMMGKSLDQAVEAVADAKTGDWTRLVQFGIKKDEMVKWAKANGLGEIDPDDTKKMVNALFVYMKKTYAGGMDNLAKTLKGKWSTVTGVFKDGLTKMAGISFDETGKMIIKQGSLYETLGKYVDKLANKFSTWQQDGTFEKWGKKVTEFIPKIIGFLKTVGSVISWVGSNLDWIIPIVAGFATGLTALQIALSLATAATTLITIASAPLLGTLAIVTGGVMLLVAAGVALYMNWDTVKEKAGEIWDWIDNKITGVVDSIIGAFKKVMEWGSKVWDTITKIGEKGVIGGDMNMKMDLPGNATGTTNFGGGFTEINERGGEIIDLPSGSRIYPHATTKQMLNKQFRGSSKGNTTIHINMGGVIVREEADINKIAKSLANELRKTQFNMA